jgi:hypothetical protein
MDGFQVSGVTFCAEVSAFYSDTWYEIRWERGKSQVFMELRGFYGGGGCVQDDADLKHNIITRQATLGQLQDLCHRPAETTKTDFL